MEITCVDVDSAAKRPAAAELEPMGHGSSFTSQTEEHEQTVVGKALSLSPTGPTTITVAKCGDSACPGAQGGAMQASRRQADDKNVDVQAGSALHPYAVFAIG